MFTLTERPHFAHLIDSEGLRQFCPLVFVAAGHARRTDLVATLFAQGRTEMSSVFEATHPIGQMAARFGNLVIALGALALGWAEWQDASRPRWLAWLAWVAGAIGLICAVFFSEASPLALAAVAPLSAWQVGTAAGVLLAR